MIRHQTRVLDSMARIRDIILTQQHALAEQRSRDQAYKPPSEFSDDAIAYQDKLEGGGGFAGADAKKRRGVGPFVEIARVLLMSSRETHPLDVAIAAIEQKLLNGGEAQMVLEHCVMLVDYVRVLQSITQSLCANKKSRLRQVDP